MRTIRAQNLKMSNLYIKINKNNNNKTNKTRSSFRTQN